MVMGAHAGTRKDCIGYFVCVVVCFPFPCVCVFVFYFMCVLPCVCVYLFSISMCVLACVCVCLCVCVHTVLGITKQQQWQQHITDDKRAVGGFGDSDNQGGEVQVRMAWTLGSDA